MTEKEVTQWEALSEEAASDLPGEFISREDMPAGSRKIATKRLAVRKDVEIPEEDMRTLVERLIGELAGYSIRKRTRPELVPVGSCHNDTCEGFYFEMEIFS